MKVKYIAAACAALGSVASYAADPCIATPGAVPGSPASTTPTLIYYISGASAQGTPVANVVPESLMHAGSFVQITGTATSNVGPLSTVFDILGLAGTKVVSQAWLGCSNPSLTGGTSATIEVVYNNTNGSAAGLNQLLAEPYTSAESYNVVLPCSGATSTGTIATPDGSASMGNWTCPAASMSFLTTNDMALSDVQPFEFQPGIVPPISGIVSKATGLESFAVIVNTKLYADLQRQNIADGLLPAVCSGDSTTLGCQPSIRSSDYSNLANENNSPTVSATTLLPSIGSSSTPIILCRRDDYSGSQASSNIFFLNTVCGNAGFGGALTIASGNNPAFLPGGDSNSANNFYVVNNPTTGLVKSCVATSPTFGNATDGTVTITGYALGVVSANGSDIGQTWHYVKLDGVSPNNLTTATVDTRSPSTGNLAVTDTQLRYNMVNGTYKFAVDMSASYPSAQTGSKLAISKRIINDLGKVTSTGDLAGIGYEDTTTPTPWAYQSESTYYTDITHVGGPLGDLKAARFSHGANNCQPYATYQ